LNKTPAYFKDTVRTLLSVAPRSAHVARRTLAATSSLERPSNFTPEDPLFDEEWDDRVSLMASKWNLDDGLFCKFAGKRDASLLIGLHYPPLRKCNVRYESMDQQSARTITCVAEKLAVDRDSLTHDIRILDRIPYKMVVPCRKKCPKKPVVKNTVDDMLKDLVKDHESPLQRLAKVYTSAPPRDRQDWMKLDKLSYMTIDPPRTRRVGFEEDETAGTWRDANWHGLTLCYLKISTDVSWYTRCMAHSYGGFNAVGIPLIGTLMQHAAA